MMLLINSDKLCFIKIPDTADISFGNQSSSVDGMKDFEAGVK
jgi:hypothetical protein